MLAPQAPAVAVEAVVVAGAHERAGALVSAQTLHDADPDAANTLENPDRVALQPTSSALLADGVLTIELPPISWTAIELSR